MATCIIVTALIQSSPIIASYLKPSDLKNIKSLYSSAASSFYASHSSAIDVIRGVQKGHPRIVKQYKNHWEENGKVKMNVKFFLFNYFINNKHKKNNNIILYL